MVLKLGLLAAVAVLGTGMMLGQAASAGTGAAAPAKTPAAQAPVSAGAGQPASAAGQGALQLQKLGESAPPKDPFPPVNPKFFTAASPTVETVNGFLRAMWGFDPNRLWRVEAIQTTAAAGVSKVTIFVTEKSPNAKVQTSAFYVLPDGKHAIADAVVPFGATPFAETRKLLQERADGPARGAASKDLLLVEFSDLQCPHCKDAQTTMDQLAKDFPNARLVYQSFPLTDQHPAALKAAEYGVCVAKTSSAAFFAYAQAVFDTQAMLTPEDTDKTLAAAVTKAGGDPAAVAACAVTPAARDAVSASVKLGQDVGVDQTPMLSVNGHMLPLTAIPYETLKQIVAFQAQLDGVNTGAGMGPGAVLQPRVAPTLGK